VISFCNLTRLFLSGAEPWLLLNQMPPPRSHGDIISPNTVWVKFRRSVAEDRNKEAGKRLGQFDELECVESNYIEEDEKK